MAKPGQSALEAFTEDMDAKLLELKFDVELPDEIYVWLMERLTYTYDRGHAAGAREERLLHAVTDEEG